jgi:hypothetical protein
MKTTALTLALYLLLGSLLPGADYGQLGKLPELAEHYRLHQQLAAAEGREVSFCQFLLEHFWQADSHDHGDEGDSHKDLPFKHLQNANPIVLQYSYPALMKQQLPVHTALFPKAEAAHPSTYLEGVFRPPIG